MTIRIHIDELRIDRSLLEGETPQQVKARVTSELTNALQVDAVPSDSRRVASRATRLVPAGSEGSDLGERIGKSLGEVIAK